MASLTARASAGERIAVISELSLSTMRRLRMADCNRFGSMCSNWAVCWMAFSLRAARMTDRKLARILAASMPVPHSFLLRMPLRLRMSITAAFASAFQVSFFLFLRNFSWAAAFSSSVRPQSVEGLEISMLPKWRIALSSLIIAVTSCGSKFKAPRHPMVTSQPSLSVSPDTVRFPPRLRKWKCDASRRSSISSNEASKMFAKGPLSFPGELLGGEGRAE
mmetsp:Transcript_30369/g.35831  ORF Transcript_30369/g.35831 Transcript_30369/m.35831 type:complete len:220 (-) Transcript_30369:1024-1683(-)